MEKPDVLDKSVAFLQKRDGIDKVLKITRYTSKLLLATVLTDSKTELAASLKNFEASVGTSRKAFRLGKFLQDVQTLRKTQYTTLDGALELVGSGGEGLYYFLEQFVWLVSVAYPHSKDKVKAGAIHKRHGRSLQKLSAWPEFVGYFGSVTLKCLQVVSLLEKEGAAVSAKAHAQKGASWAEKNAVLVGELAALRAKRFVKTLAVVQDLSDSLLALNDIWDGKGPLASPALLSLAGLVSALISAHKNWVAV
eukprot:jgi/Mesen1/672/ME000109S10892